MKRLILALLLSLAFPCWGQLTFDPDTVNTGVQNGAGTWDTTTANWWDGSGNVTWNIGVAQFGSTSSAVGGNVTINTAINATGLNFLPLSAAPTATNQAYAFNTTASGTLTLTGTAPVINIASLSTSGSSTAVSAVNFLLPVSASNLTIQKSNGTTLGYVRFTAANTGMTGLLTLKSTNGGIFLGFGSSTIFPNLTAVVVESGSVAQLTGTDATYTLPFRISGIGASEWGAMRLDSSVTLAGGIVLQGDARVHTHTNVINSFITAPITEEGGSRAFTRTALMPTTATAALSMTYTAANTYTGATNFGRLVTLSLTAPGTSEGGLNVLDFAATGAPTTNIFYNGVTAGALNLFGGHGATTVVRLNGKASTVNSQTFGNVAVNQNRSEIELISGVGGTVNLVLGNLTRSSTSTGVLSIKAPTTGSIMTSSVTPFFGAWATFTAADGTVSWAGAPSGTVTGFTGDTVHGTGIALTTAATANLRVGNASTGIVNQGVGTTTVNTISMTDTWVNRTLNVGAGQVLRLGAVGGIQLVSGARGLTVDAGKLTAGGADATAGQVLLTNLSTNSLTVNSVIDNNGASAVTVLVNGTGATVLAGANTYTGQTIVDSGSLEIRHNTALGTTAGNTQVITGASLLFSGGISTAEQIVFSGRGLDLVGALRNVSGANTITTEALALTNARINSDAGTLTFAPSGGLTANAITGMASVPITFGGSGDITVNGKLNTTGAITKDGTGVLLLAGDNLTTITSTITVSAGVLRITNGNALGSVGGSTVNTTIAQGAALELSGGITTPEAITASSSTTTTQGAIRSVSGSNTLAGTVTLGSNLRLQADAGATLIFDVASGNSILHAGTANIAVTFAGSGNFNVLDPITKTGAGTLGLTKTGDGTLNLRAASATLDSTITVNGGTLNLDYSTGATVANLLGTTAAALTFSGGKLQVTGRSGASVTQTFGTLTVAAGYSQLEMVQNGGTNVNFAVGSIVRTAAAGVLRITPATTGTLTTTGGADNAALTNDNILFATVGTNDWAATDTISSSKRNIVGLSTLSTGSYTSTAGGSLSGHANVTTATVSVPNDLTISSLRFNTTGGTAVNITTAKILSTGGILVGTGAGAFDSTITGGTIRSSSTGATTALADLVVIQNNTLGGLVISSVIANNATTSSITGFTKAGPGTVYLDTATHTFTGTTRVLEGTLHIRSGTLNAGTEVTLGSGSNSGILKLGSGATAVSLTVDWLRTDGTGTGNALVGGSTAYSTFTLDNAAASDFRLGKIGGTGTNEDNLNFRTTSSTALVATLGTDNTYKGKTTLLLGTIEVTALADAGLASSLGKGDRDADAAIIDMSTYEVTSGTAVASSTLRYIGSVDSTTNRALRTNNNDTVTDITAVNATLENTGTGTVKFTSAFTAIGANAAVREFRLGGTNTGANEIVGIGDAPTAVTTLEKQGTGTWIITGNSAHTGTTTVTNGLLQLGKGGTTGSVASTAITLASSTAILSTNRSDTLTLAQAITGTGTLRIDNATNGVTRLTSDANTYGATLVQSGTLLANNTSALSSATGVGSVTVNPGATLGGTGRIAPDANGSVTIVAGTLSVGDSTLPTPQAARLTLVTSGTGFLSLQAASVLAFDIFSGAGAGNNMADFATADLAIIGGAVTLGTDITLRVSNPNGLTAFAKDDAWRLLDWTSLGSVTISGTFTQFDLPSLSPGLRWDTSGIYTTGVISIVPEPSRMMLIFLGLALLVMRRQPVRV